MSSQQTDLETLTLKDKVVAATINVFKIQANYDKIKSYIKFCNIHKEQLALVKDAFQATLSSLQSLQQTLYPEHSNTPCLNYNGN